MDITHPITIGQLEASYQETTEKAEDKRRWYTKRKWIYRLGSYVSRGVAFVALGIGIILPLIPDQSAAWLGIAKGEEAELAYVYLVVAGLVLATDAVFLYSQTWVRFRSAEGDIERLISEFQYEWLTLKTGIPNDETAQEKSAEALQKLKSLISSVNEVIDQETETWATQLEQARKYLGDRVKTAETEIATLRKEQEAQREAQRQSDEAPKTGALKVIVENPEMLEGEIKVNVANKEEERPQPTRSIVFEETRRTGKGEVILEEIVPVTAGQVADVRFQIFEAKPSQQ